MPSCIDNLICQPTGARHQMAERMGKLCNFLGEMPQASQVIQVRGTNGKGTTAKVLAAMLEQEGYRVGLFTSPHLIAYHERVVINGLSMPQACLEAQLVALQRDVEEKVKSDGWVQPPLFELLCVVAVSYFLAEGVDYMILEAGIGGANDPTAFFASDLVLITALAEDHLRRIGPTMTEIVNEKAGRIASSAKVISCQSNKMYQALFQAAMGKEPQWSDDCLMQIRYKGFDRKIGRTAVTLAKMTEQVDTEVALLGRHQTANMQLALAAFSHLRGMSLSLAEIAACLAPITWPGRLELVTYRQMTILIDGAHNPAGAKSLVAFLAEHYAKAHIIFLVGVMDDKARAEMFAQFAQVADAFVVTSLATTRNQYWQELGRDDVLADNIPVSYIADPDEALAAATAQAACYEDALICIAGSLYLVGMMRQKIGSRSDVEVIEYPNICS